MMKKYTLLCSLLFGLAQICYGQNVRFGFKTGLNFSTINDLDLSDSIDEENRIGLAAGFFAEIPLSERFNIQPEFYYSSQGYKDPSALKIEYLQLPIGAKFSISKFYLNAGPQAGIKISNSEQSDVFKSIEFSAFGGLGFYFTENIFIEARYFQGLTDIFEDSTQQVFNPDTGQEVTTNSGVSGKNAYFMFTVGVRL